MSVHDEWDEWEQFDEDDEAQYGDVEHFANCDGEWPCSCIAEEAA